MGCVRPCRTKLSTDSDYGCDVRVPQDSNNDFGFSLVHVVLMNHRLNAERFGCHSSQDKCFADWSFTKCCGNDFYGLRILVSHAQSDAAAAAAHN